MYCTCHNLVFNPSSYEKARLQDLQDKFESEADRYDNPNWLDDVKEKLKPLIKVVIDKAIAEYGYDKVGEEYVYEYGVFFGNYIYGTRVSKLLDDECYGNDCTDDHKYTELYDFIDDFCDELYDFRQNIE